jgi:PleD family two-component response regulator
MRIVETFKSKNEAERRKNVTDAIVNIENKRYLRNEMYTVSDEILKNGIMYSQSQ